MQSCAYLCVPLGTYEVMPTASADAVSGSCHELMKSCQLVTVICDEEGDGDAM